jgi:hypothetical protein
MSKFLNPHAVSALDQFNDLDPEETPVKPEPEEEERDLMTQLEEEFPDFPGKKAVEQWKKEFGEVHAYVPPGDKKIYLFRPLRRIEHRSIRQVVNAFQKTAIAENDPGAVDDEMHQKVAENCLLFPDPRNLFTVHGLNTIPAGLLQTLFNLVMTHSNFESPQAALQRTFRL